MKNKKGWIKIVEAFIAIMLIAGVMLIVISEEHFVNLDLHSEIYESQLITLRHIQMNSSLRQSVLNANAPLESSDAGFPEDIEEIIEYLSLNSLECEAKICEIESSCELDSPAEKDIYAQSIIITVTETQPGAMVPKQLKLFCWIK